MYTPEEINNILSAHKQVFKRWEMGVAEGHSMAVRQIMEAGYLLVEALHDVTYDDVPIDDPVRQGHSNEALKRQDQISTLNKMEREAKRCREQNSGPIRDPVPAFIKAIYDGCWEQAHQKFSTYSWAPFHPPLPDLDDNGLLTESNKDLFDLYDAIRCSAGGQQSEKDGEVIEHARKRRRVVIHPPVPPPKEEKELSPSQSSQESSQDSQHSLYRAPFTVSAANIGVSRTTRSEACARPNVNRMGPSARPSARPACAAGQQR